MDLLAGCGRKSLGLDTAGFVAVLWNELEHDAMSARTTVFSIDPPPTSDKC
jgi:site-specific DNA-cytosine methylase